MFKAFNERTGERRDFRYLTELAAARKDGWTAGEAIDRAADSLNRREVEEQSDAGPLFANAAKGGTNG